MTVNDIPIVSCFQRVLDPLIVMGSLYLATLAFGEPFSGYCLVLMFLAFFISSVSESPSPCLNCAPFSGCGCCCALEAAASDFEHDVLSMAMLSATALARMIRISFFMLGQGWV